MKRQTKLGMVVGFIAKHSDGFCLRQTKINKA